ncbi:MAG: hypothetical protein A4E50_00078 [Methanosaeta sp. PtaB.Bin087]|nr:MAG: hypothetical protein A4E50_00078 [Methanosaeta sp. PtaB.Bin087]
MPGEWAPPDLPASIDHVLAEEVAPRTPIADPRRHPFTLDPPGGRKLTIWSTEAMALSRRRSSSFSAKDR